MIEGLKLTKKEFFIKEKEVTEILKKSKNFNSPTYQKYPVELSDGSYVLLKPKQEELVKLLDYKWVKITKKEIKVVEI